MEVLISCASKTSNIQKICTPLPCHLSQLLVVDDLDPARVEHPHHGGEGRQVHSTIAEKGEVGLTTTRVKIMMVSRPTR